VIDLSTIYSNVIAREDEAEVFLRSNLVRVHEYCYYSAPTSYEFTPQIHDQIKDIIVYLNPSDSGFLENLFDPEISPEILPAPPSVRDTANLPDVDGIESARATTR
jgi:hypothetical protein